LFAGTLGLPRTQGMLAENSVVSRFGQNSFELSC
jgi:hypothetical protein